MATIERTWRRTVVTALFLGSGCTSDSAATQGTEGGTCYPNGTCNAGLVCQGAVCLRPGADSGQPVTDGRIRDSAHTDSGPQKDIARDGEQDTSSATDIPPLHYDSLPLDATGVGCPHPQVTPNCKNGWCSVPPGCFWMGSPANELCRESSSTETAHKVILTRVFEMAQTEVDQGTFLARMAYNKSSFKSCGDKCPVNSLLWDEAVAYCNALSAEKGLTACFSCTGTENNTICTAKPAYAGNKIYDCPGYRLPTEAEWEYAARAGTKTASYLGPISNCFGPDPVTDQLGWYLSNSSLSIHPTAVQDQNGNPVYQANGWGFHDLMGNVWEFAHDLFQEDLGAAPQVDPAGSTVGTDHVIRGGSYASRPESLRSANRWYAPTNGSGLGFRCARTLP
jgi:formylglycine-generating enzyme required for sulfatase activity